MSVFDFKKIKLFLLVLTIFALLSGCGQASNIVNDNHDNISSEVTSNIFSNDDFTENVDEVPEFSGEPYIVLKDNVPDFTDDDKTTVSFEEYAELDSLGRCGITMACIGIDIMPTEERGSIGQVKPSGWQTVKYDNVDGKYLYNRCHLIGYQLTGENANRQNLITGTRYLNIEGMLPFENMVADYVKETKNHVLYRVTPVFEGDNLLASGVKIEGFSIEDNGEGICFNVYVYNNQPGILINYATGESKLDDGSDFEYESDPNIEENSTYILNTNTKKFHSADCRLAKTIKDKNKKEYTGDTKSLFDNGYSPCKNCIK